MLSSQTLTPRWVLAKHLNNYLTCSFRDAARGSTLPVKVISGDHDPLTPAANSRNPRCLSKEQQLTFIEDCCHMPYLEEPHRFSTSLLNTWRQTMRTHNKIFIKNTLIVSYIPDVESQELGGLVSIFYSIKVVNLEKRFNWLRR